MRSLCFAGALFIFALPCFATEILKPVTRPSNGFVVGGIADLRDDVYSADGHVSGEVSPIKYFSVFADATYRFKSIEFNTKLHDQIHELVDLEVNGLNATTVGAKVFPFENYGIALAYRFPSREGDRRERFPRISAELQSVFDFSRRMQFGYGLEFLAYEERTNFKPGNEIGSKASLEWHVFGSDFAYAILYRRRLNDSENYNLAKKYQKMQDTYQGLRMHVEMSKRFTVGCIVMGPGISYEISRGMLFGFETGHRLELFLRAAK